MDGTKEGKLVRVKWSGCGEGMIEKGRIRGLSVGKGWD